MTTQELEKVEQFRKQQFFKGFTEELKDKTIIKKFFTPNGQKQAVLIEIDGKEFEVDYWYGQAYCTNRDDKYLMDYDIKAKFVPIGFRFSAYAHKLLNSKLIEMNFMAE